MPHKTKAQQAKENKAAMGMYSQMATVAAANPKAVAKGAGLPAYKPGIASNAVNDAMRNIVDVARAAQAAGNAAKASASATAALSQQQALARSRKFKSAPNSSTAQTSEKEQKKRTSVCSA